MEILERGSTLVYLYIKSDIEITKADRAKYGFTQRLHTHTHTHTLTYIHIHIHIHTYYIHTYTQVDLHYEA